MLNPVQRVRGFISISQLVWTRDLWDLWDVVSCYPSAISVPRLASLQIWKNFPEVILTHPLRWSLHRELDVYCHYISGLNAMVQTYNLRV